MSDAAISHVPTGPWGQPAPTLSPTLPTPPMPLAGDQVQFHGDGKGFVKMLVRGALLQFVTFGFYRFWLTTDIRRHLWSNTVVEGDAPEYTGTGRELLIGFLFALAVLAPIYVVYFLIGVEAERMKAFASVPLGLFLVLFGQFAVFRARRYRLTRTIWRGVRFWMSGSGWAYAFISFGWMLLVVVTLGLAYPWRAAALERYKMRHTRYGDLQGEFVGRGGVFFRQGFWLWLAVVAPIAMVIFGAIALAANSSSAGGWTLLSLGVLGMIASLFVFPFFKALEWRWWADGVRLGGVSMSSDLRGGQILGLYLKYMVISWLVLSALGMLVMAIGAVVVEMNGIKLSDMDDGALGALLAQKPWLLAPLAVGYLFVLLGAGVVKGFFMLREYWRIVSGSLQLQNLQAADGAIAAGVPASALGEGLADGLDVAGF